MFASHPQNCEPSPRLWFYRVEIGRQCCSISAEIVTNGDEKRLCCVTVRWCRHVSARLHGRRTTLSVASDNCHSSICPHSHGVGTVPRLRCRTSGGRGLSVSVALESNSTGTDSATARRRSCVCPPRSRRVDQQSYSRLLQCVSTVSTARLASVIANLTADRLATAKTQCHIRCSTPSVQTQCHSRDRRSHRHGCFQSPHDDTDTDRPSLSHCRFLGSHSGLFQRPRSVGTDTD